MTSHISLCGERVPQPGHVCAFFDSTAEKYATLAPFFNDAIAAGDCVINVVGSAGFEQHVEALRDADVPVDRALRMDQLRLGKAEEVYMRDGVLDLEGVLDMLKRALETAEAEGRRVRSCGEMDWIAGRPDVLPRVMEYEAQVNRLMSHECTMLCVYDTATMPSGIVSDILATHSHAIINGQLRKNPYSVPPDEYLAMLRARPRV